MKHLTLIIHNSAQQDLSDQLRSMKQISGFTFSHVEGHGIQVESDPFLSARDKVVGYTPRIRADILLEDTDVEPVLDTLRNNTQSVEGRGIYWVTDVEQNGRL
jgi:nitrogen regulatory protein P-II 1